MSINLVNSLSINNILRSNSQKLITKQGLYCNISQLIKQVTGYMKSNVVVTKESAIQLEWIDG